MRICVNSFVYMHAHCLNPHMIGLRRSPLALAFVDTWLPCSRKRKKACANGTCKGGSPDKSIADDGRLFPLFTKLLTKQAGSCTMSPLFMHKPMLRVCIHRNNPVWD
jgi:hypothetical protein